MSLEMNTFVPSIDDSLIPKWMGRMNALDMRCEIHPEFSFDKHTGFLPFKISLETSANPALVGGDYLTGFEFYLSDFSLQERLDELNPKRSGIARLFGKARPRLSFASPAIEERLKTCHKVISFIWGSADSFELRMATLSSVILAEIAHGIATYPADGIWYTTDDAVNQTLREVQEYERNIKPRNLQLHRFEKWL